VSGDNVKMGDHAPIAMEQAEVATRGRQDRRRGRRPRLSNNAVQSQKIRISSRRPTTG